MNVDFAVHQVKQCWKIFVSY